MPKPFKHPSNQTSWYGNVGKGKARRLANLHVPLTEPIEVAQQKLDELHAQALAASAQPAAAPPARTRPLLALFEEYKALKTIHYRDSRRGFSNAATRVEKIIRACGFKLATDIDGPAVLRYIDGRRGPKFGAVTADKYRTDFQWFCNWLIERGHLARRPFNRRDKITGAAHHPRRVLTADEQRSLLSAAAKSTQAVYGLAGPVRRLVYWTALKTGYRSGELQFLTVACLQGDRLKLAGQFTKNKEDADQPLPAALAKALREHVRGKPPEAPLFGQWGRGAKMLRVDLKAAGIAYQTPDGLADMHSLRHSFCSMLFAVGTDAKTAHILMRHKSIEMTMSYAHSNDTLAVEAVRRLDEGESRRRSAAEFASELHHAVKERQRPYELTGGFEFDEDGTCWIVPQVLTGEPPVNQDLITDDSPQVIAPYRTRTYNPLIKRRAWDTQTVSARAGQTVTYDTTPPQPQIPPIHSYHQ
jgi:integrase